MDRHAGMQACRYVCLNACRQAHVGLHGVVKGSRPIRPMHSAHAIGPIQVIHGSTAILRP